MTRPPVREAGPARQGAPVSPSAVRTAPTTAPTTAPAARKRARRVDELDLVRVLTFACVIAVHVISHDNPAQSVSADAAMILLHFTREAFFCITGFVLTLQYGRRHLDVPRFWGRRFHLVGVPYVAWSLIYIGVTLYAYPTKRDNWITLVTQDLAFGQAWYHLYFLLVSLQVYLLFPLLAALIRATQRHHVALLAAAAVGQLAILAALKWDTPYTGWAHWMNAHESALFWNYEFWIIAGAIAAWHLDTVRAWVAAHRRLLGAAVLLSAACTLAYYAGDMSAGDSPRRASAVLQPVMLLWSAAAVAGLFLLGRRYAATAPTGSLHRVVTVASDRSFGIFLAHPFVIWTTGRFIDRWMIAHLANPWRTVVTYLVAVAGAVLLTEVLRRSPLSLILTGRPMLRRAAPAPPDRVPESSTSPG